MLAVTFDLKAKNNVTSASKDAEKALDSLGHQAEVSGNEMALSFAKGQLSVEGLMKLGQLAGQVFASMVENSAALKAEVAQVSAAADDTSKAFGDAVANSRLFRNAVDEITNALRAMTSLSDTEIPLLEEALDLLLTPATLAVDVLAAQVRLLTGAWQTFATVVSDPLGATWETIGANVDAADDKVLGLLGWLEAVRDRLTDLSGPGRGAAPEVVDPKAAEAARKALFDQVRAADAADAAAARQLASSTAAKAAAAGKAAAAEAARTAEYGRSQAEAGRAALVAMEAERSASQARVRAAELAWNQEALDRQQRAADDQLSAAKQAAADLAEIKRQETQMYADATQGFLSSSASAVGEAIATQEGLGESMLAIVGGSLQQLGGAMTAAGFIGFAPGAALFGLTPALIGAGLALTAIGAGLGAAASSGGGGSGGGGGTVSTSAPRSPAPAPAGASSGGGGPVTTIIVQGSLIRESELGRETLVAQRRARRSGVTR